MPKNLIIIPLESISNTILWQYRVELATIWRLMQRSFNYTHFYGGSVSTESVLMELAYGRSDTWDGLSLYGDRNDLKHPWAQYSRNPSSFWGIARHAGYDIFFPYENFLGCPTNNQIWMGDHNVDTLLAKTRKRLAGAKAQNKPILLMFRMVISHMAFDDAVKGAATTFGERFRLGYLQLDRAVNRLLAMLIELKMWDDSIIVCFGDHGDELWSHGLNKGFCHGTHPYASLNWTPLFIHDSDRAPGSSDRLVSMIDLRESLLKLVMPDCDPTMCKYGPKQASYPPFRRTPFDGIDSFTEKRELAFAQNLFALQLEYSDLEKALTKGYSVTDGMYRVVVSSGGHNPKNGGIEFFCDQVDPSNTRNLLDFFILDTNGDIGKFAPPPEATERDFVLAFNERAVAHLAKTYNMLKASLHEFVRAKERHALEHSAGPSHVIPESVFRYSRKRLSRD